MSFFDTLIRILLSFLLGGIIGAERETRGRSAGLRTHILVCVGSTVIMLVSLYMFEMFKGEAAIDPSRIAAGVVTGIGFLGGGAIIRSEKRSRGLTTAASVWISSAIGLAAGCGYFSAAIITTIIVFFVLSFLKEFEKKLDKD